MNHFEIEYFHQNGTILYKDGDFYYGEDGKIYYYDDGSYYAVNWTIEEDPTNEDIEEWDEEEDEEKEVKLTSNTKKSN